LAEGNNNEQLMCLNCGGAISEEHQDTGLCAECLPLLALPNLAPVDLQEEADASRPATIQITAPQGMDDAQALAYLSTDPKMQAAINLNLWSTEIGGQKADVNVLAAAIHERVNQVIESDSLEECETLLLTQAITLDAVANNLLRRGALSASLAGIGLYTKLGLRAMSQCRANLETLATIRRPAISQTNIANGPQQVNNRLGKTKTKIKISAGDSHAPLETVALHDRAKNA
jgi:hypothetical protein